MSSFRGDPHWVGRLELRLGLCFLQTTLNNLSEILLVPPPKKIASLKISIALDAA